MLNLQTMMRLLWLLVTVAARELPLAPLRPWNQSKLLQHLHVQKCGGTSIDAFFAEDAAAPCEVADALR